MVRTTRILSFAFAAAAASITGCGGETPQSTTPPATVASVSTTPSASLTEAPVTPSPSTGDAGANMESGPPGPPGPAVKYTGFATPESVYYDADSDRYLVSNINGKPLEVDNNGFISVLSPDGPVTTLKWIEGGKEKVKLNAPKGIAIAGGILYVADITTVRMFDAKTGAPKGEVAIAGSTFLNDLAAGPDGKVYVSDSGLKSAASGFEPTKTDAVYVIEKGHAKALAKSPDLGAPNGLVVVDNGVVVVTFKSGEVYRLDDKGKKQDATKLPQGGLDGVVSVGESLLVSSWQGSAVYRGKLGGTFDVVLGNQKAPADIGYDTKRNRILVPHFADDTVETYDLK